MKYYHVVGAVLMAPAVKSSPKTYREIKIKLEMRGNRGGQGDRTK